MTKFSHQFNALGCYELCIKEQRDEAALKKVLAEMKRLLCQSHNIDRTGATLCDVLWKEVEGESLKLHARTEQVTEFVFARAFKCISDSIHEHTVYKAEIHAHDPILYRDHANKISDEKVDESTVHLTYCNEQPTDDYTLLKKQRRFTSHLSTLSSDIQRYNSYNPTVRCFGS